MRNYFDKIYHSKQVSKDHFTKREIKQLKIEFNKFLKEINELDEIIRSMRRSKKSQKYALELIEDFWYSGLKRVLDKMIPDDKRKTIKNEYSDSLHKVAKSLAKVQSALFYYEIEYLMRVLFSLSVITYDLAVRSRYPLNDSNPLK